MEARTGMLELLRSRKQFFSLPQPFYNDPAYFALDLEGVFDRHWLFAGVSCQIPKPGDYFTLAIGKSSILVVRDRAGTIRAFHNTCRHRGSRICDAEYGHLSAIVCPYHLWTYDLTGRLRSAGRMHDSFDPEEYGLLPVSLETIEGTIYICLAEHPPDFAPFKEALAPYLAPHDLPNAKLAHLAHYRIGGNWKLMLENARECFHCAVGHPELARSFITRYDSTGPEGVEGVAELWQRSAALGLPYADVKDPGRQFRIHRLPLLKGAVSITMDGKAAVSRLLGKVTEGDIGSVRWAHYPTTFNHVMGDYAFFARMLPLGPEESLLTGYWLVDAGAVEGRDYDLRRLTEVWHETNDQDRVLIERNQAGVNSKGYRPGPYSQESETGVINFVEWYCETMTKFLGGPRQQIARVA
ncbi:MAG TPA: aromatic ring-hydroxylating dioxygenase subunit alpha [Stellaceae bacterium]|nr:aromatic ring-hydroxylating dioxygenase subunit alpha [Stellaceae bacterium]